MKRKLFFLFNFIIFFSLSILISSCSQIQTETVHDVSPECTYQTPYLIECNQELFHDINVQNSDGSFNAVVTSPAGTRSNWKFFALENKLKWIFKDGVPAYFNTIPLSFNLSIVPQTFSAIEGPNKADPLQVILLGDFIPRMTVVRFTPFALIKAQVGEDKIFEWIVAVPLYSGLAQYMTMDGLETGFPGLKETIKIWLTQYFLPQKTTVEYTNAEDAISNINFGHGLYLGQEKN